MCHQGKKMYMFDYLHLRMCQLGNSILQCKYYYWLSSLQKAHRWRTKQDKYPHIYQQLDHTDKDMQKHIFEQRHFYGEFLHMKLNTISNCRLHIKIEDKLNKLLHSSLLLDLCRFCKLNCTYNFAHMFLKQQYLDNSLLFDNLYNIFWLLLLSQGRQNNQSSVKKKGKHQYILQIHPMQMQEMDRK